MSSMSAGLIGSATYTRSVSVHTMALWLFLPIWLIGGSLK